MLQGHGVEGVVGLIATLAFLFRSDPSTVPPLPCLPTVLNVFYRAARTQVAPAIVY